MALTLQRPVRYKRWLVLLLIVAGAAWWWLGHKSGGDHQNSNAVRVSAAPATRQDVPMQVSLVGTVVANETVAVKSRLDSQITNVLFHDGDNVKEGQVLFELDDRTIKANIKQMQADLEKEKAQLVNARLQYERAQTLHKTNVVAQAEVDQTKAAYEAQLAQVASAQANLDSARVQLTYTTIIAPITGRTGTINVTRGNNVKANDTQALVTINQISPIRVQFAIPQRYYDDIKSAMSAGTGLPVQATHKDSGVSASGKLEYVDNTIDVSNGTFAARASFANEDEKLWPGMFVDVRLELGVRKNVLTVPAVALQGDEGNRFVFTVSADNKAVRIPVDITENNGDIAIIAKGLEDGEQVITDGLLRVTDGAPVEIVADAPKPAEDKSATP